MNQENAQRPSSSEASLDELDYLYSDYENDLNGNDYLNFEDESKATDDFSDYFLNAISQEETENNEARNELGVFIKEPTFAINKTPEEFDREQAQVRNQNKSVNRNQNPNFSNRQAGSSIGDGSRSGTNLLEPKFSIDQNPNDDSFQRRPSQFGKSDTRGRGGTNLLEPDFAIDFDNERPDSFGSFDNTNGFDIDEPDFGIDDFQVSNKSVTRNKSLPEGIIGKISCFL